MRPSPGRKLRSAPNKYRDVTDIPTHLTAVPSRLGATGLVDERGLVMELEPRLETLHCGVVRLSVLTFLVDVVAGVTLDTDPNAWTFTTDLSLRMRPVSAPAKVVATSTILRQGRRSAHCLVEVTDGAGAHLASGTIGFAYTPRKPADPPKPIVDVHSVARYFTQRQFLTRPLREEAGIVTVDPAAGVIELPVRPEVCNPAGTVQGAMVALVAEAAAEDLVGSRLGAPAVVTDLDIRYLAQAHVGPVRSRCRSLGDDADAPVEVLLIDQSTDRVTTVVYARAVAA
jgi:acyl-coenzyme A thioesterase PaaI-like protein